MFPKLPAQLQSAKGTSQGGKDEQDHQVGEQAGHGLINFLA